MLLLTMVIAPSCASVVVEKPFEAYKVEFYKGRNLPEVSITMGHIQDDVTVAQCFPGSWPFLPRHITVDADWWEMYKDEPTVQRNIIYHELGHCALGLDHSVRGTMSPYVEGWE